MYYLYKSGSVYFNFTLLATSAESKQRKGKFFCQTSTLLAAAAAQSGNTLKKPVEAEIKTLLDFDWGRRRRSQKS